MTFAMVHHFTHGFSNVERKKKVHKRFAFIDFVGQKMVCVAVVSACDLTALIAWVTIVFYGLEFRKQFTISHILIRFPMTTSHFASQFPNFNWKIKNPVKFWWNCVPLFFFLSFRWWSRSNVDDSFTNLWNGNKLLFDLHQMAMLSFLSF